MIKVGVSGAAGKMGQAVCAAVEAATDTELAGRADPALGASLAEILADCDVVVDFSVPDTALANVETCLAANVHVVVGTTGFDLEAAQEAARASEANCFVAPNFAIGAVLMMMVAQTIAPHMPECEVIELHHDRKLDAPSGTAKRTAELIDAAGGNVHRPIHSVRLPGLVAHQEVALRRRRPDAFDPPRLDRSRLLPARRPARRPPGRATARAVHGRARESPLTRPTGAGRGTLMPMKQIEGLLTAMATPFRDDGTIDLDGARRLASHLLEQGSHGLVVAGTTGECPTLTDGETVELFKAVRTELGEGALLLCGTGTNDTQHSRQLTKLAADAGADASLVVVPYYNKPNRTGIRAHFEAVAEAVPELPMVMYNIPSRVIVNADPQLLGELGREVENIVAVKQANDAELGPIEGLRVLAGNDNTFLRVLEFGGAGGITVASHVVGNQMREMWNAARANDLERARRIDAELTPVYEGLSVTTNPIPLKAALEMLGLAPGRLRLPLVPADEEQRAAVRSALESCGLPVAR